MPTYLLDGTSAARIAAGPVKVEAHSSTAALFVLSAVTSDGVAVMTITPRQDILVIPQLPAKTTVVVSPGAGASVFPPATVLNITVVVDGPPSADPERIVLAAADISGLSAQNLVQLELQNGYIEARSSVTRRDLDPLAGLAKAAQVAAREVLGVERVDAASAINLVAAVDGSASMLAASRDGSVAALIEVLIGLSKVVSPSQDVVAALVADSVTWIDHADVSSLPAAVARAQATTPLSTLFRSSDPALAGRYPDQNTVTYVLTDAVPADLEALTAADDIDGEARHLIVLSDAIAARAQGATAIPTTIIEPVHDEEGLAGRLEFDPLLLRRTITSLLNGCFVPGTTFAKRVAS